MGIKEKVMNGLEKMAYVFNSQRHLASIKDGLVLATPFTILGGFALVIANPPIPADAQLTGIIGALLGGWKALAGAMAPYTALINNLTLGVLSVYIVIGISFCLARRMKANELTSCVSALLVFFIVASPVTKLADVNAMPTSYLDAKGLFTAMIVSCVVIEINHYFIKRNIKIKLPDSVPPMVSAPFEALIPLAVNVALFLGLSTICTMVTGLSIPAFILESCHPLVSASDSLWAAMLYMFLINLFWLLGLHGSNIVGAIMNPFMLMNLTANAEAVSAGQAMPHVLTSNWNVLAGNFGGCGATIAIIIASLMVAKSSYIKSITKLGAFPTVFNISEPIVFGLPLVMNTYLALPILFVPVLNSAVTYMAMKLNLVGRVFISIPWTLPGPVGAFLATLDWKASVLWCILLVIDVMIYIPFMKAFDNNKLKEETVQSE